MSTLPKHDLNSRKDVEFPNPLVRETRSMFGFCIQTQFSVFESKEWWARAEKFLFGFCTQFLYSNIFTVQLILNLSKIRTTFTCFHLNLAIVQKTGGNFAIFCTN